MSVTTGIGVTTGIDVLGATVWLTGLPSSGKTTLARSLAAGLAAAGRRVEVLDGDELRRHLTADLGFSRADRDTNVRRVAYVARLLAKHGVLVLVPVIAPYADTRAAVRALHEQTGTPYVEVHVATPVEVCEQRDVKGLYAKARAGALTGLTGIDDPYEPPPSPDLRLDTTGRSVDETVLALHELLTEKGYG
jgi:adenylylsulfate kinase